MPVLKTLSVTSMSNDLLKELTEKSTNSVGKENFIIANVENGMVCIDNGFLREKKPSHFIPVRRNVIPYPDHNYGQPPPLTPPHPASPDPNEQTDTGNEDEDEEGVTRCICGFNHDDGYMICCDKCSAWQHIECMGITSDNVPEKYYCDKCEPRILDADKAKAIQSKKREEMSDDDDDDDDSDSDDELARPATSYTAVSTTPTRITLTANILGSRKKSRNSLKCKGVGEQSRKRKKCSKKRRRSDTNGNDSIFNDSNSVDSYIGYETFQQADENHYDVGLMNIHLQLPESTVNGFTQEDKEKKYVMCDVQENRRGLIAASTIEIATLVTEFKGVVMLLSTFEEANAFFKRSYPYVLYYNGLDHIELVVDARTYGSDARFLRRSCTANAEVRHLNLSGKLHFFVYSKEMIPKDTEITIPFDYPLEAYTGFVECVCRQDTCPALKQNQKYLLQSSAKRIKYENEQIKNSLLQSSELQLEMDLKYAMTSPGERKCPSNKLLLEVETESDDNELDVGSSERPVSRRKKMSREERKLQDYLKQIEKMEQKEKEVVTKTPLKMPPQGQVDENSFRSAKIGRRGPGKKRFSINKKRSRLSSYSSEPVSPDNNDSSSASTPTTPMTGPGPNVQPPSVQLPSVEQNGQIKPKIKREREPLTLTFTLNKSKDIAKKIRKDYVEGGAGSPPPTPPSTPGQQLSPAPKLLNNTTDTHQTALSIDVNTHSTLFPDNISPRLDPNGVLEKRLDGLLQIAEQADSASSSSGSPHQYFAASNGIVTSEEIIGDLTSRDGYLPAPEPDLSSVIARLRNEQRCRYFGSLKKHWLRQYERGTFSPHRPLNGMTPLSLETLMSDFTIRNRAHKIAASSFKIPKCNIPLKKRRLKDAMQPKIDQSSKEINNECNVVVSQGKTIYRSRSGSFSHSLRDSKKMLLTEYEKIRSEQRNQDNEDELHETSVESMEEPVLPVLNENDNDKQHIVEYQFVDSERTTKLHTENESDMGQSLEIDQRGNQSIEIDQRGNQSIEIDQRGNQSIIDINQRDNQSIDIDQRGNQLIVASHGSNRTAVISHHNLEFVSVPDEKKAAPVSDPRFSSTSSRESRESFDSCTLSRSDSISSLDDSVTGRPEKERRLSISDSSGNCASGKKKMSLREYRNRQRTKPASSTGSITPSHSVESAGSTASPRTSTASSLLNATESLLTPRTLSLSSSFASHSHSYVKETSPISASVSSVTTLHQTEPAVNGPVFEPVSPSEDEEHTSKISQGMQYISTHNFVFPSTNPSTNTISTTASIIQYHQRNNADGSSSDAMEIEDDDVGATNKILVGIPHLVETSRATTTTGQQIVQQQYSGKGSTSPYYTQHVLQRPVHPQDFQSVKTYDNRTSSSARSSQIYSQQFRG